MSIVFLNGKYIPNEKAQVSVLDRGFLFGDAVYEVIPVYNKRCFYADRHLTRLNNSLNAVLMQAPYSQAQWHEIFNTLLAQNTLDPSHIYIQISRGDMTIRQHNIPDDTQQNIFVAVFPSAERKKFCQGIHAVSMADPRWDSCHIKATTLLPNILAKQFAKTHHADDCIFISPKGHATEASSSNLFIVKDKMIYTAPLTENILPGITRSVVIDLLTENNIPFQEKQITKEALRTADEIWLSNSSMEVFPVTTLDKQPVGAGKPGSLWQTVDKLFQTHKQSFNHSEK